MLSRTVIWQTNPYPTIPTISALRGESAKCGGTAAEDELCLSAASAAHAGNGGVISWEIRLATVDVRVFLYGQFSCAYWDSCGWLFCP